MLMKKTSFKKKTPSSKITILKEGQYMWFLSIDSWEYMKRKNCTGIVIILAVTDEGKLVFVEQYRAPVGKKMIEFPAGLANDIPSARKESLATAAKRELLEEAGYVAKRVKKVFYGPISGGFSSDMITVFMAEGLKKVSAGGGDATECITVHEIPLPQAEKWLDRMQKKGYLVGPTIYAGLYFVNKYNRAKFIKI